SRSSRSASRASRVSSRAGEPTPRGPTRYVVDSLGLTFARAARIFSRSGSRSRRIHAPCHSQAAPQAGQVNTTDPPEQTSAVIAVWSYGHWESSTGLFRRSAPRVDSTWPPHAPLADDMSAELQRP